MQFVLTGFKQDAGYRVFSFDGISTEHVRTPYWVRADLGLIQRHGIRIQELPLMCRAFLEQRYEASESHALTFAESDMYSCARDIRAAKEAAAHKRKPSRAPSAANSGSAWRAPQMSRS